MALDPWGTHADGMHSAMQLYLHALVINKLVYLKPIEKAPKGIFFSKPLVKESTKEKDFGRE